MGCAPSAPGKHVHATGSAGPTPNTGPPEIAGKAKFLSCPVTGEVNHPTTDDCWFLICFAPISPYGLILAAKNRSRPSESFILVKDITDAQLTAEKDAQKIAMSWNVFFKALSTDLSKANKGGATVTFNPDGSMEIQFRIALTGSAAQSRKPDMFTCTLSPLENNPKNLYKYFVAPLATHYGKKRTDLMEKPDTAKERVFTELEATLAVKEASIRQSTKIVREKQPRLLPLRDKVSEIEEKHRLGVARCSLLRQILESRQPNAAWLNSTQFLANKVVTHADPRALSLSADTIIQSTAVKAFDESTFSLDQIPCYLERPSVMNNMTTEVSCRHEFNVKQSDALLLALVEAELGWNGVAELPQRVTQLGYGSGVVAYYMLLRFLRAVDRSRHTDGVMQLCGRLEALISTDCEFFSHARTILGLGALLFALTGGGLCKKLALRSESIIPAILACSALFVHHDGSSNALHEESRSFLFTLYPEAPLQRHAAACVAEAISKCNLDPTLFRIAPVSTILASVSCFDPPATTSTAAFVRRCDEIRDFSRSPADQLLALGAFVSVCSVVYLLLPSDLQFVWEERRSNAFEKCRKAFEAHGIEPQKKSCVWWSNNAGTLDSLLGGISKIFPKVMPSGPRGFEIIVEQPTMSISL